MKKMKKMLSLLLVLSMVLSMSFTSAFADDGETHEHNLVDCKTCQGTGTVAQDEDCPDCDGPAEVEMITCEKCDGEGKYMQRFTHIFDDNYPCPNNGFACNGCADCTMGYAVTYEEVTCDACNGTGQVVDPDAVVCGTCGGKGTIETPVDCADCENGKVSCGGEFKAGKVAKNKDGTGTQPYACEVCKASYEVSLTHEQVVAVLGDAGHVQSGEPIEHKDATCAEEGYDKYVCAVEGSEFIVPIKKLEHEFKHHICTKCGAMSFTIYGSRMGYANNYNGNPNAGAETYGYTGSAFGADRTLTMENLGLEDDKFGMFGEFVTNFSTSKVWQCVGFVPADSDYDAKDCHELTYTNKEEEKGDFQYAASLDAVKETISQKGGVLYGQAPQDNSFIGRSGIVAVWFVADTKIEKHEYDSLTIDAVDVPVFTQKSSEGVTVRHGEIRQSDEGGHHFFDIDTIVTIGANVTGTVDVNPLDGAPVVQGAQPGDTIRLHIQVVNESGKDYSYVSGSGHLATAYSSSDKEGVRGTGFDGAAIPSIDNQNLDWISRRMANAPLKALVGSSIPDDKTVGAALKALGYGSEDMGDAEITQKYLSNYYLDYINASRAVKNIDPAKNFQELTISEFSVLTGGATGTAIPETCKEVVEALYYCYYGKIVEINGVDIYSHMAENSRTLDGQWQKNVENSESIELAAKITGEEANNGYQVTEFSFRMQFQLAPVSTPTIPTIPTDPDPTDPPTDIDEPDVPLGPGPDEPDEPVVDIDDPDTPLAPAPDEPVTEIDEEDTPLSGAPKTGDDFQLWTWIALVMASGTGLAWLTLTDRKRKNAVK